MLLTTLKVHESGFLQQLFRPHSEENGTKQDYTLEDLLREAAPNALPAANPGTLSLITKASHSLMSANIIWIVATLYVLLFVWGVRFVSFEFILNGCLFFVGEDGCQRLRVVIQGIEPPLDTSITWLSQHFSHPDNFLHICLVPVS